MHYTHLNITKFSTVTLVEGIFEYRQGKLIRGRCQKLTKQAVGNEEGHRPSVPQLVIPITRGYLDVALVQRHQKQRFPVRIEVDVLTTKVDDAFKHVFFFGTVTSVAVWVRHVIVRNLSTTREFSYD